MDSTINSRILHLHRLIWMLVLPEMLTDKEKDWLNAYHRQVYDTISPYLDDKEKEWLQYETRAV